MSPQKTTPIIRLLSAPAIILICILTYWNGIENGFTYDDHYVISANELVRSVDPSQIFTSPFWRGFATEGSGTYYRPFTVLTYSLDHSLYTLAPSGFHLTNILLHTVTALLVLLLSRRLIRSERAALAAGLVFAVHPVLTEAVASASGRSDVLVTLFGLSAILCHLSRRTWVRRASCIPLFLALCSKEIGLVLPTILFICDLLWPRENLSGASHIKSLVKTHALSLAAVIAFVGLQWIIRW